MSGILQPRYNWTQTTNQIIIEIYEKNIIKDQSQITLSLDNIILKFYTETNIYSLNINLSNKINPDNYSIFYDNYKIKIILEKSSNIYWNTLDNNLNSQPSTLTKNWDKITHQILQNEPQEDKNILEFLSDVYSKGDDNVKKAMNKSFVESQGTVLSTNWNEISLTKTQIKPPE